MRVHVIGGGLIGLGAARAIQLVNPKAQVTVCEKERELAAHQSTHNSGVLHSGLYYAPGSFKAKLAVRGIRMMTEFARHHGISHEICGKLVVATREEQIPQLSMLIDRGRTNGLSGLRWLSAPEAREIEPHARVIAAVHVPEEGIIDYRGVAEALGREITSRGGVILTAAGLKWAKRDRSGWRLGLDGDETQSDFVVNCAGLQSDRVARHLGATPKARIIPFRGEYFLLGRSDLVRNLVYPVPEPGMPFLGVHYTRMIHGGVECGPNAVLALHREGYRRHALSLRDAADTLGSPRVWRFVARHPRVTWFEVRRSFSRRAFLRSLQDLVPDVEDRDLTPGPVGIRAQAMNPDGTLLNDFEFLDQPGALHVINAPSPGATASLAIGEVIARRLAVIQAGMAGPNRTGTELA